MPCRSDYLAADKHESRSRELCTLIVYLFGALEREIPDWAVKGCGYYGATSRIDEATRMLCETLRAMTPEQHNAIVYDGRRADARLLADFWEKHQEADRQREQAEKSALERDEAEFERLKAKLGK